MDDGRLIYERYSDEEINALEKELADKSQQFNVKLNLGTLTNKDKEEWEKVRIKLDEITKYREEGRHFVDVESNFKKIEVEVAKLKENNVVASKTATFEERLAYIKRLQEISTELDKMLHDAALNNGHQRADELHTQIESVRNEVLDYVKNQISQVVTNQIKKLENIERHAQRLFNELQHDFTELHDISEELNNLVAEFEGFKKDLPALRELAEEQMNIDPYSLSEKQLKSRVTDLAELLREIKRAQINNYNNMVQILNENIKSLKSETGLPQEILDRIKLLEGLPSCDVPTRLAYNTVGYLKQMNYAKLIEMMRLTNEIKHDISDLGERRNDEQPEPAGEVSEDSNQRDSELSVENVLEANLRIIEDKVYELHDKCAPDLNDEMKKECLDAIENLEKDITDYHLKLETNKDKLSEEKYRELNDRLITMENLLGIIKESVEKKEETSGYMLFKQSVEYLKNKVEYEVNYLLGCSFVDNKISEQLFEHFTKRLNDFDVEIENIRNDIKERYDEGKIDKTQFDNLNKTLDEVKNKVQEGKDKVESFEILKNNGFLDSLNGDLDDLGKVIDDFVETVETLDAPIDKKNRKLLDEMYKKILAEIDRIENNLEHLKEKEPDKYEAEMKKLQDYKTKLDEYERKYRSKCPLRVKAWRSAKNWCKKHPKWAMFAAGLATIAITHMLVGPVLIPAIMHGNTLIGVKLPFLRTALLGINNVLGNSINASTVQAVVNGASVDVWRLANGNILLPAITNGALLKGIAIVAGASAPMVGPLVVGVKKLVGKMKNREKKPKDDKKIDIKGKTAMIAGKVTDKVKETVSKIPDKVKPKKKATIEMLKEYINLGSKEEKENYFSKLTVEQQKELLDVLKLFEAHRDEFNFLEESDIAKGRGK